MRKEKISLFSAVVMNINIMIGGGIFIAPALMAQEAGFSSVLGWPLVALLMFPIVFSVSQITKFLPGQSNFFSFGKAGLNPTAGFIGSWFYFLGYASCTGILILELHRILSGYIPVLKNYPTLFNLGMVAVLVGLNVLHISMISKIQNSISLFKLLPLFFVILVMIFYFNPHLTISLESVSRLPYALPFALFAFWGFESSCNISHLIENEEKNAPRASLIAFFIVATIYTLFHLGVSYIMTPENLATFTAAAYPQFLHIPYVSLLNLLNGIISAAVIMSYFGTSFGLTLAGIGNFSSLVKYDLLPFSSQLKKENKNKRPIRCVLAVILTTFLFITIINKIHLLAPTSNMGLLGAFFITILSLVCVQIKKKTGLKIIPGILAFGSLGLLFYFSLASMQEDILYSLPIVVLTIVGIVLFKIKERYGTLHGKK
jgi:amino acid transporter